MVFNDFPERVQLGRDAQVAWNDVKGLLPVFSLPLTVDKFGPSTLMDYLGFVTPSSSTASTPVSFSPMPLIAYHLIWQEWYRNPRVQNPAFSKALVQSVNGGVYSNASVIPDIYFHDDISGTVYTQNYLFDSNSNFTLADGKTIFDLRQRNFGLDYFTGARTSAQQGDAAAVTINTSGDTAQMTIAALRAANHAAVP